MFLVWKTIRDNEAIYKRNKRDQLCQKLKKICYNNLKEWREIKQKLEAFRNL